MPVTQYSHGPSKVAKAIRKKKGPGSTSALHADSRDARKLNKAVLRDEKLHRDGRVRDKANEKYLQRVEFFKLAAEQSELLNTESDPTADTGSNDNAATSAETETPFDTALLHRLITTYLTRHATLLSTEQSQRRPGRPPSTREQALKSLIADETAEFEAGFWIPDLRDERTRDHLVVKWDGSWSALGMGSLRFVRVCKVLGAGDEGVRESRFPPKKDS